MPQKHYAQFGTFHVITNTKNRVPWLTLENVPRILIENLVMTSNVQGAKLFAFNILPDHMHIVLEPGKKGLSLFMQSFKSHSSNEVKLLLPAAKSHDSSLRKDGLFGIWQQSAGSHSRASRSGEGAGVFELRLQCSGTEKFYWQSGFYDERIRNSKQRSNAISYVQYNAGHHQLVNTGAEWPWSSLHFPELIDPMEIWID